MLHYLRRGNRLLPSTGKFLGDCCLTQMPPFPQWITRGVGVIRCDGLLKPHAFFQSFYLSIVIMGRVFSSVRCFKQETVVCNRNSTEETRAIFACLSYSLAVWFRANYQVAHDSVYLCMKQKQWRWLSWVRQRNNVIKSCTLLWEPSK